MIEIKRLREEKAQLLIGLHVPPTNSLGGEDAGVTRLPMLYASGRGIDRGSAIYRRLNMKRQTFALVVLLSVAPIALAAAQSSPEPMSRGDNLPRLGEIMLSKQWRHMKLWFAGKQHNWNLAAYELAQIRASLAEAATLYSSIPVSDIMVIAGPIQSVDQAIKSKDSAGFANAFGKLTAGCNGCHRGMGREFIEIKVPTESPFNNQVFSAPAKQ